MIASHAQGVLPKPMLTHTTRLWRTSGWRARSGIIIALLAMSAFPIYRNFQYGLADQSPQRQDQFVHATSMFHNPWQYRILCPLLVEGTFRVVGKALKGTSIASWDKDGRSFEWWLYIAILIVYRVLLHLAIYVLAYEFYRHFVTDDLLLLFGAGWLCLCMGNSVYDSDLTLNTYMDVCIYLVGMLLIVKQASTWWFVPLMGLAATNRETALMLPVFAVFSSLGSWRVDRSRILPLVISLALFVGVFVGIRLYYGYKPYYFAAGWEMIRMNLFEPRSVRTYMEMFGTLWILPVFLLFQWRRVDVFWRKVFLLMVPAWSIVHLAGAVSWESRLFLVPLVVVLLPATLHILEQRIRTAARP